MQKGSNCHEKRAGTKTLLCTSRVCNVTAHLSAIDFKVTAADLELGLLVFWRVQVLENVLGGQGVDAVLGVLRLAVKLPAHGVGLARTSLPVSKAGCHASLKDAVHKVSCRVLVHRFVGGGVVKYTVKPDLYQYSIWKSKTAILKFKQPT